MIDEIYFHLYYDLGYNNLKLNRDILNLLFSMSGEGVKGGDWEPLAMIYDMQENELQRYSSRHICILA
jgi:hypothetical protein